MSLRGAGVLLVEGSNLGQVGVEDGLAKLVLRAYVVLAITDLELPESRGLGDGDSSDAHGGGCQEEKKFHEDDSTACCLWRGSL